LALKTDDHLDLRSPGSPRGRERWVIRRNGSHQPRFRQLATRTWHYSAEGTALCDAALPLILEERRRELSVQHACFGSNYRLDS